MELWNTEGAEWRVMDIQLGNAKDDGMLRRFDE